MVATRILIVDDEPGMLEVARDTLGKLPQVEIITERNPEIAGAYLTDEAVDMLITDIQMPRLSGIELLRIAREQDSTVPILMITAFPSIESAVESMKLGATDYITKPFIPDDLLATVKRLLQARELEENNRLLQRQIERPYSFENIVGESPQMQEVYRLIGRLAETEVDVLITGDTGTGKELVARAIHRNSKRQSNHFVPVDCGAIPENLLESELFGYERGAFTGAERRSIGLLEFADGGTFFLDEVAEMPQQLQAKLLRSLQERKIRRVGGKDEIPVDVRIVAATNRDLIAEVAAGRFRQDLFYRLNVTRIQLPSLRDRQPDISSLVRHFVNRFAKEMDRETPTVDPDAMEILCAYEWPGNIRELQNVLKGALAIGPDKNITVNNLPDDLVIRSGAKAAARAGGFFELRDRQIDTFEREYLVELLRVNHGDVSQSARHAQLPRGTLYRLLKKHRLVPEEFRK